MYVSAILKIIGVLILILILIFNSITIIIINSISWCITFSVFNITAHGYIFIYILKQIYFKFTDNIYGFFFFFPQDYCCLIITDQIIDTGSFNRPHAQIYFHISDVLSRSENITDCVYINFI